MDRAHLERLLVDTGGDLLDEILFPRTDAAVAIQAAVVLIFYVTMFQ